MAFALRRITNEGGLRRFTFELAGSRPPQSNVTVVADMALARKYEIPLQELPLLCLRFLESRTAGASSPAVFSEHEMMEYASRRKEAEDLAKLRRRGFGRRTPAT